MKQAVLIFSGYNQRAVIALCRVLRSNRIDFGIVAASRADPVFQTVYADAVIGLREVKSLDADDMIRQVRHARQALGAGRLFVAPTTEALNRFLLLQRQQFEQAGCVIPLVDAALYGQLSDKLAFTRLCEENGIRVPRRVGLHDGDFPLVAKPRCYASHDDGRALYPAILHNAGELERFLRDNDETQYFWQEYVRGRSYYLLYHLARDGQVLAFSQENLLQQPGGKSIVAAQSSRVHTEPVSDAFVRLFRKIGYHGLVMVEIKAGDEGYCMIEANPRLWGPSQLFVDAGCPLLENYLADYGFEVRSGQGGTAAADEKIRYCWFGGLLEAVRAGSTLTSYACDPAQFMDELPRWLAIDIYNRPDTRELFLGEIN